MIGQKLLIIGQLFNVREKLLAHNRTLVVGPLAPPLTTPTISITWVFITSMRIDVEIEVTTSMIRHQTSRIHLLWESEFALKRHAKLVFTPGTCNRS